MNDLKRDIHEDAKSDWMKTVENHKKKQNGLPALSSLSNATNEGIFNRKKNTTYYVRVKNGSNYNTGILSGNIIRDVESALRSILRANSVELKPYRAGTMTHGAWMFTTSEDVAKEVSKALNDIRKSSRNYVQKDAVYDGVKSSDEERNTLIKNMIVGPTTSKYEEIDPENKKITLNKDAGNVEHNIKMFNMMQPDSNVSVDASNGNISGNSCCESCSLHESKEHETVILEYENIPVEVVTRPGNPSGYYNTSFGNWLPDDDETTNLLITWNYKVDKQDVIEYLQELDELFVSFNIDPNIDDESLNNFINDNLEDIVKEFEENIKEHFYEFAVEDAQENYEYEQDIAYESYDDSLSSVKYNEELDDKFDMSMRTLL